MGSFQQSLDNLAIIRFIDNLGKTVYHYSEQYENFLPLGDFNTLDTDQQIRIFMNSYALSNLVKEPTCCKSNSPRRINLIFTNRCRSFPHTTTIETDLSDFHKTIVTVLKTTYQKIGPTVINYRDYKNRNSC